MVKIRASKDIKDKWLKVTPERADMYEAGVKAPLEDWESQTIGAEKSYEDGIKESIADKRFSKGVKKVGTAKWQKKTLEKGVPVFADRVRIAGDDYEKGFAPYRDEIEKTTLPARFPKGDPRNIERVKAIALALYKKRVGK